ncbi:Crp/Fnr family transcriptional regulator [Methylobacterium soli]|uniref:Crp/Fnr family transcriptional regulator n=1 Tax=Methylobacterium soli TaxID=553447 RepID=A0A6L3SWD5_9HYPH|nr:Crp/Fnr family transcriptional regulator [Methylobacterium soli]KAB1076459.1 Crp/Fnr family transcriptional regulator [Methylobacterium soli]GJE44683.1 Transcriptional activatory protein AadR [Methylobacterium soli]
METLALTALMNAAVPGATRVSRHPSKAPADDGCLCALARRLESLTPLAEQDRAALEALRGFVRSVPRNTVLMEQEGVADHALVVLAGFASRYKRRVSGRRQIVGYLVPGDFCDRGALHAYPLDHAIETLTDCRIAKVPRVAYLDLLGRHPRIALALQHARLAEEATTREWVVNLGMRSGLERTAHLLCELMERLESIGHASDGRYDLPLTQVDLADALGLSSVHVNRVLQALRRDGLISLQGRCLQILAPRQLQQLAEFEGGYL